MVLYSIGKFLLGWIFILIYGIRVKGRENEPKGEAYLFCANHTSANDAIVSGMSVKAKLHFFAKSSLFKNRFQRALFTALGAMPVEREVAGGSANTIKSSIKLLGEGKCVAMFPQGRRYTGVDPRTTKIKNGAGMIAYHTKCKVLPVCIQTKNWHTTFFHRTEITIGKPITYEELGFVEGKSEEFERAAEYIFGKITDMIHD